MRTGALTILVGSLVFGLTACAPSQRGASPAAPVAEDAHDHGHSHEELGPHGGHLVELGEEDYHIEWTHDDDDGLVTLYILDGEAKEVVPIAAETISIQAMIEDTSEYKLGAVAAEGEPPMTARFELKDPALIQNLKMAGQGVDVTVALEIDGKPYTGKFEHHDHAHHHH